MAEPLITETEISESFNDPQQHHEEGEDPTTTDNNEEVYSQEQQEVGDDDDDHDHHHIETVDELLAHTAEDIGNWCDLLENDLPSLENGTEDNSDATNDQTPLPIVPEVYQHKVSLVLGNDLTICQLPDRPPFNLLAYGLPDAVTEEELYMLFGGRRAIESYTYRRDLREIIFSFRKIGHLIDALLKQDMAFKEKPLRLALVFFEWQIDNFHQHNDIHGDFDLATLPFKGAFDKCHERLEDGSLSELFDDMADTESVSSNSQIPPYRKVSNSNDVRMQNQQQYSHQNSIPGTRQRNESVTSITSGKSYSEQPQSQNVSRQSSYQPPEKEQQQRSQGFQTQQIIERQPPPPSPASSTASQKRPPPFPKQPRSNPFGDAKPVNTEEKFKKYMTQKSMEQQQKNAATAASSASTAAASMPQDFKHPPPQINNYNNDMVQGTFKIQKRPEGVLPAPEIGKLQWTNSMYQQQQQGPQSSTIRHTGPSSSSQQQQQQQQQPSQSQNPKHGNVMEVMGDKIDVSKPPPPIKSTSTTNEKRQHHQQQNQRYKKSYQNQNQNQQHSNGFISNNIQHSASSSGGNTNSYTSSSHRSLPPAPIRDGGVRRKSSTDQHAIITSTEIIETEKSQSAPVSHETVAMLPQSSPRSSPSYNSLKRPNSANSSMSFVTAHSGSEMSSAMSTDLPCIPSSIDSITERLSDITDDHRRHSWEGGRNSPGNRKEKPIKKNSFGSRRGPDGGGNGNKKSIGSKNSGGNDFKKSADGSFSRQSSTSTPQYQSASNVFLDVSESSEATEKASSHTNEQQQPEPEHKILNKTKNGLEKRAPSLPLSRPHTSSNEKTTNTPKLESNKPDSVSAPPTPSGSNNKKKTKDTKKDKNKKPNVLQNNKFSALENAGFD